MDGFNQFCNSKQGKTFFAQVGSIARSLATVAEVLTKNHDDAEVTPDVAAMNHMLTKFEPDVLLEMVLKDTCPSPRVVEALNEIIKGLKND